ncbi:ribosome maturation factor RimM [Hoeflea prorocentri]|uniref:Ribosome maturation factor RimM n=1 Tax=Hoeflea prorocentri TaxID=1922333 RepID=A0A9X3ZJE9_9HYPH|nr:ribosome maturation factor RimM [Hoeflea prorocentri]MCY6383399.1 ribosome maturation factor RimM [Hoeflea prorocentri]MDA5401199.1 ribosome maturation factor RimM [Hoeflea prorocentri]
MAKDDDRVLMAEIGAPHGLRGEVRAKFYTEDPQTLGSYGPLFDEKGRAFKVLSVRPAKNVVVLRLEGVSGREAAEAMKGTALYISRDSLPDDGLEDDEFFQTDLVGLAVLDDAGKAYGTVTSVHNFGAGDILELADPGKRAVMIPFSETAVCDINWDDGQLIVDPVAAGLDDQGEDEGPGSRRRRPPKHRPATSRKDSRS